MLHNQFNGWPVGITEHREQTTLTVASYRTPAMNFQFELSNAFVDGAWRESDVLNMDQPGVDSRYYTPNWKI